MDGIEQIMEAIMQSQMNPQQLEVDEMQQGQQQIEDQMMQIAQMGKQPFSTGIDAIPSKQVLKGNEVFPPQ